MATELITTLPQKCFPTEIDTLVFRTDEPGAEVPITIVLDGDTLLDARLHSDGDGILELRDLAGLLQERMETARLHLLEIYFENFIAETALYPCRVDAGTAEQFLQEHFLSLADGRRLIPAEAPGELLTWYAADAADNQVTVSSCWYDASDQTWYEVSQTLTATVAENIYTIDIAPLHLDRPAAVPASAQLVEYEVSVGSRRQKYTVAYGAVPTLSVRFQNALLAEEDFHFIGTLEHEQKITRSAARFSGRLRNYATESYDELTAHTGPIPDSMLPVLYDLAATMQVWRHSDGRELIVTDSEAKHTSDSDHMLTATITFRESQRPDRSRPRGTVRTFDATFDQTYE